ncbi:hypothetical protein [Acinetobacter terrestris]|mgnify:CR=1 FL=1|jgi:hypothetical protein|uniref:hypothetical protein n=1 Tax=Acinetobacter terrestris TaxID=2529843 RepID=UPI00103FBADF|nr:hypothetical protein [Acinetobacter terrestris]TCB69641.1 hypothetical protein E0H81_00090 [Acinetobacter terrestris]
MKSIKFLVLGTVVLITGCSAKVVTYDATGQVIGSCKATSSFILGARAICYGGANSEGVDYSKINQQSGLLPLPPKSAKIMLSDHE